MPLDYVPVRVTRLVRTRTATGGHINAESELAGSPFLARVYRVASKSVERDEAQPATATVDKLRRLSVLDPACPISVGDMAYLPLPGGIFERAKALLVRAYADRTQYDLETGAEGDAPPAVGGTTVQLQAELDALTAQFTAQNTQIAAQTAQITDLTTMFHLLKTGTYTQAATLTASTTLAKAAQSTTYPIDTTAGAVVITLPASTGDGTDYEFIRIAGTNPVTFVVNAADTCPLPLVNTTLNAIGETQSFREMAGHIMEAH